jgi:hypothetical protein
MKRIYQLLWIAALTMTATACESPASSQDRAIEVQQEAQLERAAAEREAQEKIAKAQAEANAAVIEARDEAQRAKEAVQADVAEATGEASQELVKARNDLREWSRSKLQGIDRTIASARAQARSASAEARANFDEVMRDADARRAAIQEDIASFDRRSATEWEQFKTSFEARVDALEARLKDARARL